ncbi:MAG: aminotransferase class V-fold PLP-dependent enzyme [Phycisphaerae bacterium]|nr:aminotransferase class V-fold PLP-dependent enzyme [Phycisphaerae bacterium]
MTTRIYFDNAATSFPKPEAVYEAVDNYGRNIGASAGRGAYSEAMESAEIIQRCRQLLAELLNADDPLSMIMTFNCTDGLSLAIKGIITDPDSHVITTCMDHNSVLRPLNALQERLGIDVTFVKADSEGMVDPLDIEKAIKSNTKLIAVVHGSNVCGSLQDVNAIGRIAKKHNIAYLVDAAQTVGHVPIDVKAMNVDMLAFPGHKALLGPLGTGALYIRPGFEGRLSTLKEGGTGSKSELATQPEFMPDRFESGSHNAIGIAGLCKGLEYVLERGIDNIASHDRLLCERFLEITDGVENLTVYGPRNLDCRLGVFSIRIAGFEPQELAAILEKEYGILTRPGLHCAPLAHKTIGTLDVNGTTRLSTGPFISINDIEYAGRTVVAIASLKSL